MKTDFVRDYSTAMFRLYARTGGVKPYIKYLTDTMKTDKGSNRLASPTEGALIRKEALIQENAVIIMELEVIEKVLELIRQSVSGDCILKALEYVYFRDPANPIRKGEIEARVGYAERHIPASRRQIYRWLKRARVLYAEERGLVCDCGYDIDIREIIQENRRRT